jgi:dTDP-4-dehydrorhamnose 3,5-epimerase
MNNKFDPKFHQSKIIKDLVMIKRHRYPDYRGQNWEGYNEDLYQECSQFKDLKFKVDSYSRSHAGVIRGFHGDLENWKLITCLKGEFDFKAIDIRENSPTFGNIYELKLTEYFPSQVLLPPGVVNAHLAISPCIFAYKLSNGYVGPEKQLHIKWNDPKFNLSWKISNPILSDRDK